jgi:hypothetical protein
MHFEDGTRDDEPTFRPARSASAGRGGEVIRERLHGFQLSL